MPTLQSLRFFFRRRRKSPVLGGQQPLLPVVSTRASSVDTDPPLPKSRSRRSVSMHPKVRLRVPSSPLRTFSRRRTANAAASTAASLDLDNRSTSATAPHAARAAVEKFLAGPEPENEEERDRRQCIDVLRKLSASGRVPGYAY